MLIFEVLRGLQLQWQVYMKAKGLVKNKNTWQCTKVEQGTKKPNNAFKLNKE
jgi:hypothetical protein